MTEDFRIAERALVARRPRQARRNSPVEVIRVHPRVWAIAFDLAGGDTGRLVVLGPNQVVVANRSRHANQRREA